MGGRGGAQQPRPGGRPAVALGCFVTPNAPIADDRNVETFATTIDGVERYSGLQFDGLVEFAKEADSQLRRGLPAASGHYYASPKSQQQRRDSGSKNSSSTLPTPNSADDEKTPPPRKPDDGLTSSPLSPTGKNQDKRTNKADREPRDAPCSRWDSETQGFIDSADLCRSVRVPSKNGSGLASVCAAFPPDDSDERIRDWRLAGRLKASQSEAELRARWNECVAFGIHRGFAHQKEMRWRCEALGVDPSTFPDPDPPAPPAEAAQAA